MPTYCYTADDDTVERTFKMGKAPQTIRLEDDRVAARDYRAESVKVPASRGWPLECFASGVQPSQRGELRKFYDSHGCSDVQISRDGNPIYESATQRKRALRVRGMNDRNSFI